MTDSAKGAGVDWQNQRPWRGIWPLILNPLPDPFARPDIAFCSSELPEHLKDRFLEFSAAKTD